MRVVTLEARKRLKTKPHISWSDYDHRPEVYVPFRTYDEFTAFSKWRAGIQRRGMQGWPQ